MQNLFKIRKDLASKWERKLPEHISTRLPWDVLEAFANGLSSDTRIPRDAFLGYIRNRDVAGLFSIADSLEVTEYTSPDLLLQDRLACESFTKFNFANSPFNKRETAKIRFFQAESMCREANLRIKHSPPTGNVNRVIHGTIRRIASCLGSFRPNEMLDSARFGPGSTLCVTGKATTEYFKYKASSPTVSSRAFPFAEALINHDPKWRAFLSGIHPLDVGGRYNLVSDQFAPELSLTDYNKVTFVPKNAKTERSIAIEPYFNIFFQLGVGQMLRNRLKRCFAVDLNDQTRNQVLAKVASQTSEIATVDFSMASDTIATEVVRLLLPPEWFSILDRLRSTDYLLDGAIQRYHKFSSMGNGFTFELETLIFHSLALSCAEELGVSYDFISTYGDDVIIPTSCFQLFTEVTEYLGFKVNDIKSFSTGLFRESCGKDYLKGVDVRPLFCRELDCVKHVVSLANRLLALDRAVGVGSRVNGLVSLALSVLRRHVPRDVLRTLTGPPSDQMDTYVHSASIEEWVNCRYSNGFWLVPAILPRSRVLRRADRSLALLMHQRLQKLQVSGFTYSKRVGLRRGVVRFSEASVEHQITLRNVIVPTLGYIPVWSPGPNSGY